MKQNARLVDGTGVTTIVITREQRADRPQPLLPRRVHVQLLHRVQPNQTVPLQISFGTIIHAIVLRRQQPPPQQPTDQVVVLTQPLLLVKLILRVTG